MTDFRLTIVPVHANARTRVSAGVGEDFNRSGAPIIGAIRESGIDCATGCRLLAEHDVVAGIITGNVQLGGDHRWRDCAGESGSRRSDAHDVTAVRCAGDAYRRRGRAARRIDRSGRSADGDCWRDCR